MTWARPSRETLEREVCALIQQHAHIPTVTLDARWDADIWESLDEIDFKLHAEFEFDINIPNGPETDAERSVWERAPFRVRDFVDYVELRWGSGCKGSAKCEQCRYPLDGLLPGTCPECGRAFRKLLKPVV